MQDDAKRLEPCPNPWCNSHKTTDAEIRAMETPILMPSRASSEWAVACPVCPVQTPFFDTEAEAIAAWNRRTPAPAQPAPELVEVIAAALARCDGLDWDETCGREIPDGDECDSGTCVAAHWEDHDAEYARRWYMHRARAALAAMPVGEPVQELHALPADADADAGLVELLREAREVLRDAKREMWSIARHQWNMADFKNWAIIQQIDVTSPKIDTALGQGGVR